MLVIRDDKNNAINHNNRKQGNYEHNKNIKPELISSNKQYVSFNTQQIEYDINKHYEPQIKEYNNNQKRQSYKVENYFKEKKVIKNQRELLVDISPEEEDYTGLDLYEEFYKNVYEYLKTRKDMYLTNVVVHNDEHRPHMHVNWIPINKASGRIQSWTTFNTWKNQNTEEETKKLQNNEKFIVAINKLGEEIQEVAKQTKIKSSWTIDEDWEEGFTKKQMEFTKLGTKKEKQIHIKVEEYKEKIVKKAEEEANKEIRISEYWYEEKKEEIEKKIEDVKEKERTALKTLEKANKRTYTSEIKNNELERQLKTKTQEIAKLEHIEDKKRRNIEEIELELLKREQIIFESL